MEIGGKFSGEVIKLALETYQKTLGYSRFKEISDVIQKLNAHPDSLDSQDLDLIRTALTVLHSLFNPTIIDSWGPKITPEGEQCQVSEE